MLISSELNKFIIKSSSGGDLGLEEYLGELFPSIQALATAFATSKPLYVLQLQSALIDAAMDKSMFLVDYFTNHRDMVSDSTTVSTLIGDGETDNYRDAMSRMRDRENSWNRVEREGEEDTKTYHVGKAKGRITEDTKHYDLGSNRSINKKCSFEQMQSATKGKGDSADFNTLARKSSSLAKTGNVASALLAPAPESDFSNFVNGGATVDVLGGVLIVGNTVTIPPIKVAGTGGTLPGLVCSQDFPDDIGKDQAECSGLVQPSFGFGVRSVGQWNWNYTWSFSILNINLGGGASGGGSFSRSNHVKNEQVCSSATSSVVGTTFGHNDYAQTDSARTKGTAKEWGKSHVQHNSGNYTRGERVSYSQSKGEVKGNIEFCSQSDSASRRLRVATGNVKGVSDTWARTEGKSGHESKRISNSISSRKYWNQVFKNLISMKKLLMSRIEDANKLSYLQAGTAAEETLFTLCTFDNVYDSSCPEVCCPMTC